jgi:hypothetical protein
MALLMVASYTQAAKVMARDPSPSTFWCPQPYESSPSETSRTSNHVRSPNSPPNPLRWTDFTYPTFAMSLIPPLPDTVTHVYKTNFLGNNLQQMPIRLLRLYLGRMDYPDKTESTPPGLKSDLPLDIRRYNILKDSVGTSGVVMPIVEEVSRAMGIALARLHWLVGINARDVELVLAGDGKGGIRFYIFDYNQVSLT